MPKKTNKIKEKIVVTVKNKKNQNKRKARVKTTLLKDAGGWIGGMLGGAPGRRIGQSAGSWFSKVTGLGEYKIQKNVLVGQSPPAFSVGRGAIVCHREFVGDVVGTTSFANSAFRIQPGDDDTFPWLSQVAVNYEQYEFEGLIFEYKPTCGSAVGSTNTALGTVIFATNYNSIQPDFITKNQMENYEFSTSCSAFDSMIHPIECKSQLNTLNHLYVEGTADTPIDRLFADLGKFQVGTVGMQASNVIGELWVSYCVRLIKPRLYSGSPEGMTACRLIENPANTAAVSGANYFGTDGGLAVWDSGMDVDVQTNYFVIPHVGYYLIAFHLHSGANITSTVVLTPGVNAQELKVWEQNNSYNGYAVASTSMVYTTVMQVLVDGDGSGNRMTISGGTGLTTGTNDVFIAQIPQASVFAVVAMNNQEMLLRLEQLEKHMHETMSLKRVTPDVQLELKLDDKHCSEDETVWTDVPSRSHSRNVRRH